MHVYEIHYYYLTISNIVKRAFLNNSPAYLLFIRICSPNCSWFPKWSDRANCLVLWEIMKISGWGEVIQNNIRFCDVILLIKDMLRYIFVYPPFIHPLAADTPFKLLIINLRQFTSAFFVSFPQRIKWFGNITLTNRCTNDCVHKCTQRRLDWHKKFSFLLACFKPYYGIRLLQTLRCLSPCDDDGMSVIALEWFRLL